MSGRALLLLGFTTGLSGAMIPGPLMFFTVSEAFRRGQVAGVLVALGHLLLEAIFVVGVVLGLRDLLSLPSFRTAVAWVGGIGLILMGGLILSSVPHLSLPRRQEVVFRGGPLLGGVFFSIASPGFLIWWATIGVSVLLQGALWQGPGIALVSAGHATPDIGWLWFVAWSVERGRAYCTDRIYRLIMAGMALWLVFLGVRMAASGWYGSPR